MATLDVTLINNTEKNDDWMKSLPGYKNEVEIHKKLGRKSQLKKRKGAKKVWGKNGKD